MDSGRQKTSTRTVTPPPVVVVRAAAAAVRVQRQGAVRVSSPADPAEREAVATAQAILRRRPVLDEKERDVERGGRPAMPIARVAEGQPDVGANVAAELSASLATGSPLPLGVRRFMEPRFGADFSSVRIHTGGPAGELNRQFNAQAFTVGQHIFFGAGRFQPDSEGGRELIAHELTHTIQQGAAVQRSAQPAVVERAAPQVQRLGIGDALDYFADKANVIPGFRMFTIVLGVNPINMSRVERSAANILRAVVEFIPGGSLITQALDNHGVFDKVGQWVEQQIAALGMTGAAIKAAVTQFLDSLGWRDIFDLGGVWARAKRIFTEPIDRIIGFAKGLITGILKFIKEAILRPLAKLAEGTRGYDLLKAVLGEDPVTGEPVPRTADTLIGGFMKLIGQEEIWENLKKSNAVPRAWAWFQSALASLLGFVRQIPGLVVKAFQSLELFDVVLVPRAFAKIASVFGGFVVSFITWAGNAVWSLLEIIFAVVAPGAMPYLQKAAGAFRTILKNPIGFVGNLVRAGKLGFEQFATNIGEHLKAALIGWLTGTLAGAAIYIPQSFAIREIVKFVLSVLGLTWANIRQKLVRVLGETVVKALEVGFDIVVTLVTEGPAAAWEKIKEQLTNLKEMILDEIMNFVVVKVVQSAVVKLVSMLNPAGAFIQAIIAIYNTVMFFIERLRQIIQVATAFIDSIAAIASGVIAAAANRVEKTLAGLLTLAISFLARLVGLGKVSDIVVNIVNKIRAPIDRALDRVVEWIVATAKRLGKFAAGAAGQLFDWASAKASFTDDEGAGHSIYVDPAGAEPTLKIASNPMAAREFLDWYLGQKKDADFQKDNADKISAVRDAISACQAVVVKINAASKAGRSDTALQRQLLEKNVTLGAALSSLVGSDRSIGKAREKYNLEGLTGTYGSMPKPPGDDFTADHQPQAAILQAAAEFSYFSDNGELVRRAAGRAKLGYAINLHKIRHVAGATFGSKGKATKEAFLASVKDTVRGKPPAQQRQIVVGLIRGELNRDVDAMNKVVGGDPKTMWKDIMDIGGRSKNKKANEDLVKDVRGRILAGERQLAAQDLNSLVG